MSTFVDKDSIVRKIWGTADTVLFIFAGSAAEFALNKAVDWLYFTGKLPADPLGRLFSTVAYARQIIFSDYDTAIRSIDQITAIHKGVEQARGSQIPDWAYRDVLFMLIDYSIRSFELLERKLTLTEKAEVFDVFNRVGQCMGLKGLPGGYLEWEIMRDEHLQNDLISSKFTVDLYKQYRKHLGPVRNLLMMQVQAMVVPLKVKQMLGFSAYMGSLLSAYKLLRWLRMEKPFKNALLPDDYKVQIQSLDI
ncbi:oxygenase MpaB family protein [Mucilaginibacter myungsuensis]|uniref:DUF2236 domain-containing protein n=1 Tax=Mucilaginibacter myungsuensis TaxID=649104 RepID=A0A929L5G9_9SPHI|nr:oxygenase MpaB family protein [Mucilaginibacter myungsuensis]MBE9663571.1 DUF2236 domain-containing protein [Mucilaginibacter myungsuensis]MDN3599105.1 oxygenase MpaB family protein [Mucilaginibacter myungsuensis]